MYIARSSNISIDVKGTQTRFDIEFAGKVSRPTGKFLFTFRFNSDEYVILNHIESYQVPPVSIKCRRQAQRLPENEN